MTIPDGRELAEAVRRFQGFYARHVAASHEPFEQGRFRSRRCGCCMRCCVRSVVRRRTSGRRSQPRPRHGNLSRLLTQFERGGLVAKHRSVKDRRRCLISITRAGESALNPASEMRQAVTHVLDALARRTGSTG
jgi:hypothetical protein